MPLNPVQPKSIKKVGPNSFYRGRVNSLSTKAYILIQLNTLIHLAVLELDEKYYLSVFF